MLCVLVSVLTFPLLLEPGSTKLVQEQGCRGEESMETLTGFHPSYR
jgi:hypothetical protein